MISIATASNIDFAHLKEFPMEPHIYNAFKFVGNDSNFFYHALSILLLNNQINFEIDDDGILAFLSEKVLDLDAVLGISTIQPDCVMFWSWSSEWSGAQGFFRIRNGKILKRSVKVPR